MCVAPPQIWCCRFPISKQQSYNQEWQEMAYALISAKAYLDLNVKQQLKLKNINYYQMVQLLGTFPVPLSHKNPFRTALVFTYGQTTQF
jgi:hypothetical protein